VRSVTARRRLGRAVVQARALCMAGSYRSAATCLQRAIARYEARPEVDPVGLGVALNEFGMIGKYSGDFDEAERAYLGHCGCSSGAVRAATVAGPRPSCTTSVDSPTRGDGSSRRRRSRVVASLCASPPVGSDPPS
jgi:hypothetical protein